VNDVATNNQYWPVISCDTTGRIAVIYFDERQTAGQMNAYLAYSIDNGDSWVNERLSDVSFPGNQPNDNVRYGDYINIDAHEGRIVPVWTDDRAGSYNQEIYTAIIDINLGIEDGQSISGLDSFEAFPNPFTDKTNISLKTSEPVQARIEIYNLVGERIELIADQMFLSGMNTLTWNSAAAPGIYYVVLTSSNNSISSKLVKIQ
jgi:hypothetical protein